LITDQGKEFCNKLSDELFKLMEMKHGRTSAYHPQCNSQAEVANKTIAKYLRNVVDTTTLDWEAYLAPLMFSYNTSFHRTIQTSPYFLTFGQMARQPAFNQGDWQKKYLGETSAAEKFQILQQARQIAWQNSSHQQELNREVYDRQAEPHNFHKNQWVWLKIENFLNKNRKLAPRYEGPYKIISLKPHNNVEIAVRKRSHVIVHVNRLKPYHDDSKFQTFTDNFQKQGGDEDFDFPPNEEEKIEIKKPEMPAKRRRGRPKKVIIQDQSESEEEARFPTMEEARYNLRQSRPAMERFRRESESRPKNVIIQDQSESEEEARFPTMEEARYNLRQSRPAMERFRKESERPETENESDSESDDNDEGKVQGYDPESSSWIVRKLRAKIEREMKTKQSQDLIKAELIKVQLIDAINPFITECRELIKMLPAGVLKRDYPSWNHNQIINYWWSGDINEGPDDIGFSLADNPYLPPSVAFGGRFAHDYQAPAQAQVQVQVPNPFQGLAPNQNPVPIEINENLFEDEDDFATPPASPQAPTPESPGPASSPVPTGTGGTQKATASGSGRHFCPDDATLQRFGIKPYDMDKVRPELQRAATFAEASTIPNLNADEAEFFKKSFYLHSKLRELQQEEGRKTRTNKTGIRSFLTKKKT
jgi:hypothetical protein